MTVPHEEDTQNGWQRLSVRELLVTTLIQFGGVVPVLFFLVVLGDSGGGWMLALLVGGAFFGIAAGLAEWLTVRWRVTTERMEVRRGLFSTQISSTPLERVRTVDLTASLLRRLLGTVEVSVGTGASDDIKLSGLTREDGERLRVVLLQRSDPGNAGERGAAVPSREAPGETTGDGDVPARDTTRAEGDLATPGFTSIRETGYPQEVARLEPRWLVYAPLTLSGLAVVAGAVGAFSQVLGDLVNVALAQTALGAVESHLAAVSVAQATVEVALTVLAVFCVAAVASYALRYWNYLLVRQNPRDLRITRGLTTTYSSTIELARLRGVSVEQPVLLGLARAAKLKALVAGQAGSSEVGADLLLPPAPLTEVNRVASDVLGDDDALTGAVHQHGSAARRRRHARALWLPLIVAAVCAAVAWWWPQMPASVWWVPATLVISAPLLAEARYAVLGHLVTDRHVVARSGLFPRTRTVVQRDGIIAWQVHSTWFQRRVGLVTLVAVTAAPAGNATIIDLPSEQAADVLARVDPASTAQYVNA